MEPQVRLVHWYDTERRRIGCHATGQSNSTKHLSAVTCTECLAVAGERRDATHGGQNDAGYLH